MERDGGGGGVLLVFNYGSCGIEPIRTKSNQHNLTNTIRFNNLRLTSEEAIDRLISRKKSKCIGRMTSLPSPLSPRHPPQCARCIIDSQAKCIRNTENVDSVYESCQLRVYVLVHHP